MKANNKDANQRQTEKRGQDKNQYCHSKYSIPSSLSPLLQQARSAEACYLQTNSISAIDDSIDTWQQIWSHPTFNSTNLAFQLAARNAGAILLMRRYRDRGAIQDLTTALAQWEICAMTTPDNTPDLPKWLNNLGTGLRARYEQTGTQVDLQRAIQISETAVAATPTSDQNLPRYLNNLGVSLLTRYGQTGSLADLQRVIETFETALTATPDDSPDLPSRLNNLGIGLRARHERMGSLADLERAIEVYEQAVAATPDGSPDLPSRLSNLGNGLHDRYMRMGKSVDLERAIKAFEDAVNAIPDGSPMKATLLNNLSVGLIARYEQTGALTDLQRAIQVSEQAVAATTDGSPDLPSRLNNLGTGLRTRYGQTGSPDDLERAIETFETAVTIIPDDAPKRITLLNNLGISLCDRYKRTGSQADLERATSLSETAVIAMSDGTPDLPGALNNFGNSLRARYNQTGALVDLERTVKIFEAAVAATSDDSPERATLLNNLSISLRACYRRTGDLTDLERAIQVSEAAVATTSDDAPDLPSRLNNLGSSLRDRYRRTGVLADLKRAIKAFEDAVVATPDGSPERAAMLNNLGTVLRDHYGRTGALEDLQQAIQISKQAVAATPDTAPDLPSRLNNLGVSLSTYYERTDTLAYLEQAIQVCETAVAATPNGSPKRAVLFNNLGNGLRARYGRTKMLADLEQAIVAFEQALAVTPDVSLERTTLLNNLGNGLRDRYRRTGSLADLERAIQISEAAVTTTSDEAPARAALLNNLGVSLRDRYEQTKAMEDLERATDAWQKACKLGQDIAPEVSLASARTWGQFALEQGNWSAAVTAYDYGMQAIKHLYQAQLRRTNKETWLKDARGIPAGVAYAHAMLRQWQAAIVALEQGRARLLSEVLERDHANLKDLKESAPDIYAQYVTAADKLRGLESQDISGQITLPPGQTLVEALHAARSELDIAIEAIRTVPGYEDFLAAPDWAAIQAAATESPLVYIIATPAGGLALIVDNENIIPVWLDALTEDALREQVQDYLNVYGRWRNNSRDDDARQTWFKALENVITWLHETIMVPIQAQLPTNTAHATLIPTGYLALLPLHAAGEGVFTYAPNALALANTRKTETLDTDSLLAINNPDGSLSFSSGEVSAAIAAFDHTEHLPNNKATKETVLAALPQHKVWHFSTHGVAGWQQPLESRLLLADGLLTLRDILQLPAGEARLAILSACETGIPGTELPDEVIGLPTGLLQAGVAGVVGSLWTVNDLSTALLMTRFYQAWKIAGQSPLVALHTAQNWLCTVTNAQIAIVVKLLPGYAKETYWAYHLAKEQNQCPFAHPFYWAGFYYTGV